jgi:hypothetical protein
MRKVKVNPYNTVVWEYLLQNRQRKLEGKSLISLENYLTWHGIKNQRIYFEILAARLMRGDALEDPTATAVTAYQSDKQ